jgi:hypothetical protein
MSASRSGVGGVAQDVTEGAAAAILATVRRFWGFEGLRPLQAEAIRAGLTRRDSLVVMPTGAGKSLWYQVPPAVAKRSDVVVSPFIARLHTRSHPMADGPHGGRNRRVYPPASARVACPVS